MAKCTLFVADDDSQWLRFWNVYPCHANKKDARKAWAQLNPSPELVEIMLSALAWQIPLWARQGYGMPYPATWIRSERWDDEPPAQVRRQMSTTAATILATLRLKDDNE